MLKLMYAIYVTKIPYIHVNQITYLKYLLESKDDVDNKIEELEKETIEVWCYDDTKFYAKKTYKNINYKLVLCYILGDQATIINDTAFVTINQSLEKEEVPSKYYLT